jgi:hypothetical protein
VVVGDDLQCRDLKGSPKSLAVLDFSFVDSASRYDPAGQKICVTNNDIHDHS